MVSGVAISFGLIGGEVEYNWTTYGWKYGADIVYIHIETDKNPQFRFFNYQKNLPLVGISISYDEDFRKILDNYNKSTMKTINSGWLRFAK